jgi:hypothetical protein
LGQETSVLADKYGLFEQLLINELKDLLTKAFHYLPQSPMSPFPPFPMIKCLAKRKLKSLVGLEAFFGV